MSSRLQFFVDIDRETLKRIDVRPLGNESFSMTICIQFDRGWETDTETLQISGRTSLSQRLIREGVTQQAVYDDLAMEAPPSRTLLTVLLAAVALWLLLAVVWVAASAWF